MHIDPKAFEHITRPIIESAIEVHRQLGAGLLESAYSPCVHYELTARKLRFQAQRTIPLVYKGIALDTAYRLDLVVEHTIVLEVKSVAETLADVPLVVDDLKRVLNPAGSPRSVG